MKILIDTNVLLRSVEPAHPHHQIANQAITRLIGRNETLIIVPQIIYEYWVAATRPVANNGLGFGTVAAHIEIEKFKSIFLLLDDEKGLLARWTLLVSRFDVKGKPAHDARLVAAMELHGVANLLTFNLGDFSRYPGMTLINPQTIATE
jgi:predicted nucleic acid-binding protein